MNATNLNNHENHGPNGWNFDPEVLGTRRTLRSRIVRALREGRLAKSFTSGDVKRALAQHNASQPNVYRVLDSLCRQRVLRRSGVSNGIGAGWEYSWDGRTEIYQAAVAVA